MPAWMHRQNWAALALNLQTAALPRGLGGSIGLLSGAKKAASRELGPAREAHSC